MELKERTDGRLSFSVRWVGSEIRRGLLDFPWDGVFAKIDCRAQSSRMVAEGVNTGDVGNPRPVHHPGMHWIQDDDGGNRFRRQRLFQPGFTHMKRGPRLRQITRSCVRKARVSYVPRFPPPPRPLRTGCPQDRSRFLSACEKQIPRLSE